MGGAAGDQRAAQQMRRATRLPAREAGASERAGEETGAAASLIDSPLGAPPQNLKDISLFPAFPDMIQVHARAVGFKPRHELWSNGLGKARFAILPDGRKNQLEQTRRLGFPHGTLFFKTFFQDPGAGGKQRRSGRG